MNDPRQTLTERFQQAITRAFGEAYAGADPLIRPAGNPKFGDYQANVAMGLAKRLGRNPREVAAAIVDHLDAQGVCKVPEIAGPGFINLALTPETLAEAAVGLAADDRLGVEKVDEPRTVVLDYSSPNVAKEMHVGHLRSTVIGDALARTFEFLGHHIIRQNHVGDWGTQFGMLIERLVELGYRPQEASAEVGGEVEGKVGGEIRNLNQFYQNAKAEFDADPDFADRARRRVVALQSGDQETLELWHFLVRESEHHFYAAYERLNVTLGPEDIRPESFYNSMLDDVVRELERRGITQESGGAVCVFVPGYEGEDGRPVPLIIRKADGGYGYAATDLAAIRYRTGELGADRIAYVVDARQKDHFAMVFWTAQQAGWLGEERCTAQHVPFGTILGEGGRPFKTRSGETVRLSDLLDEAERRAAAVVAEKNPELGEEERARVAAVVGIGAVKYGDLSGDRVKDYVFSWDRMLAMEGNTAPYLQYAYARVRSIFRKAPPDAAEGVQRMISGTDAGSVRIEHPAERALVLKLVQLGPVARSVADHLEPHRLCNWLYELATAFSTFYENCPVLRAPTEEQRATRLMLSELTARALKAGLDLLGIRVLERM